MISKKAKQIILILTVPIITLGTSSVVMAYTTQDLMGGSVIFEKPFSISSTGRFVAFISTNTTLVPNDTNNKEDAFLRDNETGQISLISITPSGNSGNGTSNDKVYLTGNGRYVLFSSESTNLTSTPATYGKENLYFRDLQNSTTTLLASGGANNLYPIGLSEDGRFIYYYTSGIGSISALDRINNTTTRVDISSSGVLPNGGTPNTSFKATSCDGRFVVFSSSASNLVDNDTNAYSDIFLVDQMNGHYVKNITSISNGASSSPEISCDGNFILFRSAASNLVPNDLNNNADLFKYTVATSQLERVSLKNDGSEYTGTVSAAGDGAFDDSYAMSMDGRYIFFRHSYGYSSTSTARSSLLMRDTKLNTTTTIAPSGSNSYPKLPAVTNDGKKVFYIQATNTLVSGQAYLKEVTDL